MPKIVYRPHLKRRIRERKFPHDYPRLIYQKSKRHFIDIQTKHMIAVFKLEYFGKLRDLVISYDILKSRVEIITIYPLADKEIKSKINSGRWKKL